MNPAPQRIKIEVWRQGARFAVPVKIAEADRPGLGPSRAFSRKRQRMSGGRGGRSMGNIMFHPPEWPTIFLALLLLLNVHLMHGQATNGIPRQERTAGAPVELSAFKIISERNIFNANRSSRQVRADRPAQKPAQVEALALVGTLSSDKGSFAFFDGTASAYKKALKATESIAGYTIKEITPASVKLESAGKEIELRVGMQMRRQDEGEWLVVTEPESYAKLLRPPAADESEDTASNGEVSDVLKKLMQKREQELNK